MVTSAIDQLENTYLDPFLVKEDPERKSPFYHIGYKAESIFRHGSYCLSGDKAFQKRQRDYPNEPTRLDMRIADIVKKLHDGESIRKEEPEKFEPILKELEKADAIIELNEELYTVIAELSRQLINNCLVKPEELEDAKRALKSIDDQIEETKQTIETKIRDFEDSINQKASYLDTPKDHLGSIDKHAKFNKTQNGGETTEEQMKNTRNEFAKELLVHDHLASQWRWVKILTTANHLRMTPLDDVQNLLTELEGFWKALEELNNEIKQFKQLFKDPEDKKKLSKGLAEEIAKHQVFKDRLDTMIEKGFVEKNFSWREEVDKGIKKLEENRRNQTEALFKESQEIKLYDVDVYAKVESEIQKIKEQIEQEMKGESQALFAFWKTIVSTRYTMAHNMNRIGYAVYHHHSVLPFDTTTNSLASKFGLGVNTENEKWHVKEY